MCKMRDLDGTVDRCPPPPHEMWKLLYALQLRCSNENMDIVGIFEEGGGNHQGFITVTKFKSTLKGNFPRYQITEDTMARFVHHYGTGYKVRIQALHRLLAHMLALAWRHYYDANLRASAREPTHSVCLMCARDAAPGARRDGARLMEGFLRGCERCSAHAPLPRACALAAHLLLA